MSTVDLQVASATQLQQQHHHHLFPSLLEAARSLASVLVISLFALTFLVQPFRIPSESMERTLLVGDFLLVNKSVYGPAGHWGWLLPYGRVKRGDVVVFHFPLDPPEHVVKRVIGVPGDRIHLRNGEVFVNGRPISEPYAVYEQSYRDSFRDQFPLTPYSDPGVDSHWWLEMRRDVQEGDLIVPANNYFVLGDNRNHSRDSRYWGFVPKGAIVGRPLVVYFSLRQQPADELPGLPQTPSNDRLGHDNDPMNGIVDFARWDRMFHIVR
ncbi:signal peptidase I [Acidipila rosea]|uniref:Signal peptidase I n=1 Tax=Acidipila rosea TaxID=768535 RepID=A0A4R1L4I5_9BACT|nr:signal peptidase I [Acidipila rosea]MBW4028113.1 signal peptidase I [Acidobacteriota bacterium]MBW4046102.1 signal peptidase I [Acidobacteriota bacterium]TCK71950.1 signal peptidase I [Acidipila rosea]